MYFVYEDWTKEINPRCFYVGKGRKRRINCLLRNKKHTNISVCYGIDRKIVFQTFDENLAFELEMELIKKHNTFSTGETNVFGANFTSGGEGVSAPSHRKGKQLSESHIQNISLGKKGKPTHWTGTPKSEKFKDLIRKQMSNRVVSDETRKKISEAAKGNKGRIRPIEQLTIEGILIDSYSSMSAITKSMPGMTKYLIKRACSAHSIEQGFRWRWKSDEKFVDDLSQRQKCNVRSRDGTLNKWTRSKSSSCAGRAPWKAFRVM